MALKERYLSMQVNGRPPSADGHRKAASGQRQVHQQTARVPLHLWPKVSLSSQIDLCTQVEGHGQIEVTEAHFPKISAWVKHLCSTTPFIILLQQHLLSCPCQCFSGARLSMTNRKTNFLSGTAGRAGQARQLRRRRGGGGAGPHAAHLQCARRLPARRAEGATDVFKAMLG